MILLKNGRIKMLEEPSLQHLLVYKKCLEYLAEDMRDNGVHTTAYLVDVAITTLGDIQTNPPTSVEEEREVKKLKRKLKKAAS